MDETHQHTPTGGGGARLAPRPLWKAASMGAAFGAIPLVLLIGWMFSLTVPSGYAGAAVGVALLYLLLIALAAVVVGAVAGAVLLRTRRSLAFTLLAVPAVLVVVGIACFGALAVFG